GISSRATTWTCCCRRSSRATSCSSSTRKRAERMKQQLLSILFALTALVASAHAFQGESSPTLDAARARWERLSPEEKARLEKNYERYRALTEEERRGLA